MTIEKRLARSNIAMLAIPLITAAALAACGALVLLRGNLAVLYDAVEQAEKQKKQKLIAGMSHDLKSPPDLYPGLKRGPAGGPGPGRKRAGGRPADRVHAAHCKGGRICLKFSSSRMTPTSPPSSGTIWSSAAMKPSYAPTARRG